VTQRRGARATARGLRNGVTLGRGRAWAMRVAVGSMRFAHPLRGEVELRAQHVRHGRVRHWSRHLGLDERMQLRVQHVGVLALGDLVELGEVAGPVVPGEYPPAIARLAASLL